MTWREMSTKGLWLAGMAGYPYLLVRHFQVGLVKALLGGFALAFVTPIVFVVLMDLVDHLRTPARPPQSPQSPTTPPPE